MLKPLMIPLTTSKPRKLPRGVCDELGLDPSLGKSLSCSGVNGNRADCDGHPGAVALGLRVRPTTAHALDVPVDASRASSLADNVVDLTAKRESGCGPACALTP